jgi:hypothetical protein
MRVPAFYTLYRYALKCLFTGKLSGSEIIGSEEIQLLGFCSE